MSTGWTLRRRPGRPAPSPGFPTGAHCEKWQGHRPLTLWQGHFLLVRHHPRADVRRGLGGSLILSLAETGDRQPHVWGSPAKWLHRSPSTVHRKGLSVSETLATTKSITKSGPGCPRPGLTPDLGGRASPPQQPAPVRPRPRPRVEL